MTGTKDGPDMGWVWLLHVFSNNNNNSCISFFLQNEFDQKVLRDKFTFKCKHNVNFTTRNTKQRSVKSSLVSYSLTMTEITVE